MNNKSDAIVAFLVIVCSLVLLGALVFSIAGNPFDKPHLSFTADFEDLTGIKKNSAVLYAGNEIGVVSDIEHLPPEERLSEDGVIRAHIAILKEIGIPANIDILISSESMLGEKHIALKRKDDQGGLLADGAQLSATSAGSMLDMLVPGGGAIVANLEQITEDIKEFTDGIGQSTVRRDIGATMDNIRQLTESAKDLLDGTGDKTGLSEKLTVLADDLRVSAAGVKELIEGPAGAPQESLGERGKVILANFEEFSKTLNATLAGDEADPGLRARITDITEEVQLILAGDGADEEGMRKKLDSVMTKVDTLVLEIQALVVWGEYITGTLAEKPSRIIWGSKENEVPTKEQVIEHLRETGEPYPVRIREHGEGGDPAVPLPAPSASPEASAAPGDKPARKKGGFRLRSPSE